MLANGQHSFFMAAPIHPFKIFIICIFYIYCTRNYPYAKEKDQYPMINPLAAYQAAGTGYPSLVYSL